MVDKRVKAGKGGGLSSSAFPAYRWRLGGAGDSRPCAGISDNGIEQCQSACGCGKHQHQPGPGRDGDAEAREGAVQQRSDGDDPGQRRCQANQRSGNRRKYVVGRCGLVYLRSYHGSGANQGKRCCRAEESAE